MNKLRKLKLLGITVLTLAVAFVGFANATLTMDAVSVTGDGAVTINAAPGSDLVIGSAATTGAITIGAGTATAVSITDDNWSITTAGVGTLNKLRINGTTGTLTAPLFGIGVYATPVVDGSLLDNIAFVSNFSTTTDKTVGDTSSMAAFIGNRNTAGTATPNTKLQGLLASTLVNANVYDAYGVQGHIAVKQNATAVAGGTNIGNIAGVSAKATVDATKTAIGTVSGVLITMDGTGTVTGNHNGLWMDTVVNVDNGILISGTGTVTTGLNLAGTYTTGISIPATATTGITSAAPIRVTTAATTYTAPAFSVGLYQTPLADTALTDNIQATITSTTAAQKTDADTSSMALFVSSKNTVATDHAKLQSILASTTVNGNVFDAYGVQGHVKVADDATAVGADTNIGNIVGVSAKATVDAGKTATGTVSGLLVTVDGTGTVTGQHSGIWVDSTTAAPDQAILLTGNPVAQMKLSSGAIIYSGTAATRAAVRTQVGDSAPIGSMYIGVGAVATTKPYTYIKVLNGPGDTDWERVVTQAQD